MAPREQPDREQEDYRPDIVRPRVRRGREAGGGPTENADEWREDWHSTADTGNESERAPLNVLRVRSSTLAYTRYASDAYPSTSNGTRYSRSHGLVNATRGPHPGAYIAIRRSVGVPVAPNPIVPECVQNDEQVCDRNDDPDCSMFRVPGVGVTRRTAHRPALIQTKG